MSMIIGLGEILWDVIGEERTLGGAPANFAFHAHQLGHRGLPVTRIGRDLLGDEILERLTALGLETQFVQIDAEKPTGRALVDLRGDGPSFTIVEDVAWDYLTRPKEGWGPLLDADLICFGTLAQRSAVSREAIRDLVTRCPGKKLLDVNLRAPHWSLDRVRESLELCDGLKLNEDELAIFQTQGLIPGPSDPHKFCEAIRDHYGLELVCLTRGANGSVLFDREQRAEHPGIPATVADSVGAGDAFTAAVADGWLRGLPLATIAERANRLGSFVASQPGATPRLGPEFTLDGL